ncbi:MAG: bifunctional 5,10-methylene-tetrahydrofolate dehydrogenase/5,10-methylene-tetrahydrofolate cyclohydrolase [Oscillospiraceae bacterium]|nr:bifunctional 5,10-methylene-tetrahydrofolate dehydrogenase/5,10-methylene-tetrahydrofolate cyclohydrolase [Oscillospiraceae bacterium]
MPAEILRGAPVAAALSENIKRRIPALAERGVTPCLGMIRIGEREADLSYERSAAKRCEALGIAVRRVVLPAEATQEELLDVIGEMNRDAAVHGVLFFRPLPERMDARLVSDAIAPEKDVDGIGSAAMAAVYAGLEHGFFPCTAQAVIEMLRFYGLPICGKRAVVVGRSLVTGRPAALLLLREHATVTVCHTRTQDLAAIVREAELVVTATGCINTLTEEHLRPGQIVIDIGMTYDEKRGKLCGDVDHEAAERIVRCISAVPGGIGAVTSTILCSHVVEAAEAQSEGR